MSPAMGMDPAAKFASEKTVRKELNNASRSDVGYIHTHI